MSQCCVGDARLQRFKEVRLPSCEQQQLMCWLDSVRVWTEPAQQLA